jgi:hypothetical protein
LTSDIIGTSSGHGKLTRTQVVAMLEQARAPQETLDLAGSDLRGIDLGELHFEDVAFGGPAGHAPARLARTSFGNSSFVRCLFAHADLDQTDFRGCRLDSCDFRYATFSRAQLAYATIRFTDFYRATFADGTVLSDVDVELVSLESAQLESSVGPDWQSFRRRDRPPALVQESAADYAEFLKLTARDRPQQATVESAFASRLEDAARVYRRLSGLWTSRGQFHDAESAYVHSRRLEREAIGPRHRGAPFRPLPWLLLWAADLLCAFGQSLGRVAAWILVVALLPGFAYWGLGGVDGADGLLDNLLFGASQLTASTPSELQPANRFVAWIGLLQTFVGVALLGLFGFVLGNKMRSS